MTLNVLQVVTDTDRRGAQVFAVDLGDALYSQGRRVRTVALAPGDVGGLDLPCLGTSRLGVPTLLNLRREIAAVDVVVGHGSSTLPACVAAGLGLSTPFVYRSIGDVGYWANTPMKRWRVRRQLQRAAAVVALWPAAAKNLADAFSVDPRRVHAIPTGVPSERFAPAGRAARAAARARLRLPEHAPTILYIGALSAEKNVQAAIRAVAGLPGCQLLIVGDGPERSRLQALAGSLSSESIHFHGPTRNPPEIFAACDAVVLPSLSEGLPGVLVEAGLSGLPLVATPVGGVGEIVIPGKTGEFAAPDDIAGLRRALATVLARSTTYGEAARRRCLEAFDLGIVASAWYELLSGAAGAPTSN